MVLGLFLIVLFFIWLFHRSPSPYTPKEDDEEVDLLPSRKFWEKMAKFDDIEHGILAVLCLLFGSILIYNNVANYFDWPRLF